MESVRGCRLHDDGIKRRNRGLPATQHMATFGAFESMPRAIRLPRTRAELNPQHIPYCSSSKSLLWKRMRPSFCMRESSAESALRSTPK